MTYPESIEAKIGFDAVRRAVRQECISPLGAQLCDDMSYMTDFAAIEGELGAVAEMVAILGSGETFPIDGIADNTPRLGSIRPAGTFIPASELPLLRRSVAAMGDIAAFLSRSHTEQGSPYPNLDGRARRLQAFPEIVRAIDRVVDPWGNIPDTASPELADIRRMMARTAASVSAAIRRVMAAAVREGYLEADATPAVRDGRPVIPVAPMYKRKIQGIVHDESASGKTCYIEPAEVVEANNRLRELEFEERREITRILMALADTIRPRIDSLIEGHEVLGVFDFIHAKARYARTIGAELPHLQPEPALELWHACHPVLKQSLERQGKQVVPLDLMLDAERRILVISGPNAGGKSVTLKTVAIVQYMAQCGLLPPVAENSHMGVFRNLMVDIGDDQSIEDDLSTYSSHLRNMKNFLSRGDSATLILIDEFGSGTEPTIGGAIAQALLKQYNEKGMWGVITTHFQNLKQLADEMPGLVNGSMLYDRQKMKPMFRLAVGQPGSSFAIEIARQIGLPESIIKDASEIVGSDYVNIDRYLLNIARDRRYWENKRDSIRIKEKKISEVLNRYENDAETLRTNSRQIIADAKRQAREILDSSNAAVERTIRDIREAQADKEQTRQARERLQQEKRRLADNAKNEHENALLAKAPKAKKKAEPKPKSILEPLQVGDNVLLDGQGTPGTIRTISGKEATVVFGQLLTTVKLNRLTRTMRKPKTGAGAASSFISTSTGEDIRRRQLDFKQEIDVRGMRVDEALQTVTYFIDDAIQFGSDRVRILHGTGTGALRQYIRNYLNTVRGVAGYHDEDVRFGGAGITVVEFE